MFGRAAVWVRFLGHLWKVEWCTDVEGVSLISVVGVCDLSFYGNCYLTSKSTIEIGGRVFSNINHTRRDPERLLEMFESSDLGRPLN